MKFSKKYGKRVARHKTAVWGALLGLLPCVWGALLGATALCMGCTPGGYCPVYGVHSPRATALCMGCTPGGYCQLHDLHFYKALVELMSTDGGLSSGVSQSQCKSVNGTESHAPGNTPKTRKHNLIYAVVNLKRESTAINRRLRSTFCTIEANY